MKKIKYNNLKGLTHFLGAFPGVGNVADVAADVLGEHFAVEVEVDVEDVPVEGGLRQKRVAPLGPLLHLNAARGLLLGGRVRLLQQLQLRHPPHQLEHGLALQSTHQLLHAGGKTFPLGHLVVPEINNIYLALSKRVKG